MDGQNLEVLKNSKVPRNVTFTLHYTRLHLIFSLEFLKVCYSVYMDSY